MRSFDVFDTLIARKCVEPEAIFALVENDLGMAGFARMRIEAERRLQGREYQIDDIYAQLRQARDLPADTLSFAQERELLHELDQVIPIARHLAQVGDGDVLVTDTYLPTPFIGQLLERAGLRRVVSIVRSADGKATGRIWQALQESVGVGRHLGDNPHSDGEMARRHGIRSTISGTSRPTPLEEHLSRSGYRGIALLARILRLGIADNDPVALALKEVQANINIPLLILASMDLRHRIANSPRPPDRLLFSSRDCLNWQRIFQAMPVPEDRAGGYDCRYFLTSRIARVSGTPAYVDYFRSLATERSLVIDLCGTGLTLAKLYATAGIAPATHLLYMIGEGSVRDSYGAGFAAGLASDASALVHATDGVGNLALELMNAASHGMALDAAEFAAMPQKVYMPRLAPVEYDERQLAWLEGMADLVETATEWFADPFLESMLREEALNAARNAAPTLLPLLRQAEDTPILAEAFLRTHLEADASVYAMLGCSP